MNNNTYPSRYSNGKTVSAAQYITELICEHKAQKDKLDLHFRFWIKPEWDKYYRNQIGSAHKLLKKYSAKAIIKALQDYKAQKIYSLRAPHLVAIIEQYESILSAENRNFTKEVERKATKTYRSKSNVSPNNNIAKLRELDNES